MMLRVEKVVSLLRLELRRSIAVVFCWLAIQQLLFSATIGTGDVTSILGPTFFVDDAANAGNDIDINEPNLGVYNRYFSGLLNRNQGPTRVILTGFGFAAHSSATANDATSLAVTFTYLGADESLGGGDDVSIGTATGTYNFTVGGEYVFAFDTPLTADLTITGTRFRIQIAPSKAGGNGSLKLKASTLTYETTSGPSFSVSGIVVPQRLNLAKYQTATTDSVLDQRLATYLTDGVVGNDNRWVSDSTGPHWAKVTFPFPVQVGSAQVFSGWDDGSALTSFKLQYLSNSIWTDVPGGSVTSNTNVERNIVFTTPVTASAFRIYDSVDATMRVKELALYPPNGASGYPLGTDLTLNLAQQRQARATSNTAGNFALLAVDGRVNKDSKWQTTTSGAQSLEIDLRVSTKIGSAHLYSGSPGVLPLSSFVLRYWDGSAWQNIPGASLTGNTTEDLVIPFTSVVTTTKVRLEFTNSGTTSVREMCIFPRNSANAGYPIGSGVIGNPQSSATFDDYNDAFYKITNSASSKFMAVSGGEPVLSQPGLTAEQGQYQILLNIGTSTYRLRNRSTGYCLSGARLSSASGAVLEDAPYSALPDQDWILHPLDSTGFRLINQWSGLVIDTQGGGTAAGTPLVQNVSNSSASQRWQMLYSKNYPKKGVGGTFFATAFNANWAYNWGMENSSSLAAGVIFNPMQWGDYNWSIGSDGGPNWQNYPAWRTTSEALLHMGFNEPDVWSQSGKSLDPNNPATEADFSPTRSMTESVLLWPRLQAMDLPLVAPCPANMTGGWLSSFYTQATSLGYRVDYTAKHSYPSPNGGSSDNLISELQTGWTTWGKPMWLTEFSFVDWGKNSSWSEEDSYNCLAEFLWRAESVSWLRRYALFVFTEDANNPQPANTWQAITPAPRSNSRDINGNLTAFGELYAAWDSAITVEPNKSYFIHNRDTRKRLANVTTPSSVAARSIRINSDLVRWTLVASPTSGRYYVVSSLDGRRLSYDGSTVSMVASGTIGTAVQWSLTESEYGWFFLGHPETSKRLKLAYNNSNSTATYSMVANTNTGDELQWRFIVPLPPPTWIGAANNSWTSSANWSSNTGPTTGNTVQFNSSSGLNLATVLNQNFSLDGVNLTSPGGLVSVAGTHSLTLGVGGFDLSSSTQNLTVTTPIVLGDSQIWNVATGRTLSVNGGVSGSAALTIAGAGTTSMGGAATYTGVTTVDAGATLRAGANSIFPNGPTAGGMLVNGKLDLNGTSQLINGLNGSGTVDNLSGGSGVITVGGNNESVSFSGSFQDTSGNLTISKTGTGDLTLSSANTHSGGFINHGVCNIKPQNNACFGTGPVVMNTGTIYSTASNYTFSNALTLNGAILRVGGANNRTLTLSGPVGVTGNSGLAADGSTTGVTVSGSMDLSGATFASSCSGTANTISGIISGSGEIIVTSGTLNLNAANTFGGTCRSAVGTLKIGSANAMQNATIDMNAADGGSVNLNNLNAVLGALTGSRGLALGSGEISIGNTNQSTVYSGVLSGLGGLTKIGNGKLTLSNTHTYSGATKVNAGTLALGASNVLPTTAVTIGNATLDAATFAETVGTLKVGSGAKINLGSGSTLAFASSSSIDWSGGSLTITGSFVSGSSIRFGSNASALTSSQLGLISASGFNSFSLNSSGYLIATAAGTYISWASTNATSGNANHDFDGDGVSNGVEYLLGGNKNTNDRSKLPQISISGGNFVFSFKRSQVSIDGNTSVMIDVGTQMTSWPSSYAVPAGTVSNSPGVSVIKNSPAGFDTVTLVLPISPATRQFARLRVVVAP